MSNIVAGFNEIEHTADWELNVWAPDLSELFEYAARGMYSLAQTRLAERSRLTRELEIAAIDPEILLVDFLSELLFIGEDQGLGFDNYDLFVEDNTLKASITGAPIVYQAKEIKAVTFHRMEVRETERGLEVNIVFDV